MALNWQMSLRSLFKQYKYFSMSKDTVCGNGNILNGRYLCTGSLKNFQSVFKDNKRVLESRDILTNHFGSLRINVPFHVCIESLDPQLHPDMNQIILKLFYAETKPDKLEMYSLAVVRKLYELTINKSENLEVFQVDGKIKEDRIPVICHLQLPLKFDLDIKSEAGTITVKKMESENIKVQSNSCTLTDIKCAKVNVECQDGDITSNNVLQGNATLQVKGQGNISTDRLQGTTIKCSSDKGNITTTSVYCENCDFRSNHGNIALSNCHGNSKVKISQGNLSIDSLEGSLDAVVENGSADVYITRSENINIQCHSGNIGIKVGETIDTSLDIKASDITCDEKLAFNKLEDSKTEEQKHITGYINGKAGKITAVASLGNVTLKQQDWFHSLKLKNLN